MTDGSSHAPTTFNRLRATKSDKGGHVRPVNTCRGRHGGYWLLWSGAGPSDPASDVSSSDALADQVFTPGGHELRGRTALPGHGERTETSFAHGAFIEGFAS